MRVWHEQLIPKLCRQHLLACWYEGWSLYSAITNSTNGWKSHPQRFEYEGCPELLWDTLYLVKIEMLRRGFNPMPMKPRVEWGGNIQPWQSLVEQIEILRSKGCQCEV